MPKEVHHCAKLMVVAKDVPLEEVHVPRVFMGVHYFVWLMGVGSVAWCQHVPRAPEEEQSIV